MAKKNSLTHAPYRITRHYEGREDLQVTGYTLCEYSDAYPYTAAKIEWRVNEPFFATLELEGMERGRSAARYIWFDRQSVTRYPMFMSSMLDLLQNDVVDHGEVGGWWIVVKKGQNYGIERYEKQ